MHKLIADADIHFQVPQTVALPAVVAPAMRLLKGEPSLPRTGYTSVGVGVILLVDGMLCLQQRCHRAKRNPNMLANWSGGAERGKDKSARDVVRRELKEELGVTRIKKLVRLCVEDGYGVRAYRYAAVVARKDIKKCTEGKRRFFRNVRQALKQPKLHGPTRNSMIQCQQRRLVR